MSGYMAQWTLEAEYPPPPMTLLGKRQHLHQLRESSNGSQPIESPCRCVPVATKSFWTRTIFFLAFPTMSEFRKRSRSSLEYFFISPFAHRRSTYTLSRLKFAREKWNNPSRAILPVIVEPVPHETIPEYLKAVTILEPKGNVAAEVTAAVSKMVSFPRRLLLFITTGLIVLAALIWFLFPHRQQSRVDLAISLNQAPSFRSERFRN